MAIDYSNEDLRGKSFKAANLANAIFRGADLRGANFSEANLHEADFSNSKSGLTTKSKIALFTLSLIVSCFSGYIAMLAGHTIHILIDSGDTRQKLTGYVTLGLFVVFIVAALWKGVFNAIRKLFVFMIAIPLVLGAFMYLSGLGTGIGALYSALALSLLVVMFIVGTISRAAVGSMGSTILFLIVAVGGATFGRSLGGGIGTIVMALSCAIISKKALKSHNGSMLKKIALTISSRFGTSFSHSNLTKANFTNASINNADFSHAIVEDVVWKNSKNDFLPDPVSEETKPVNSAI